MQYQSEHVSIFCVLISVPQVVSSLLLFLNWPYYALLWNWGCFVFPKAWPMYRDDSLAILDIGCRKLLKVWEGVDHSALGLSLRNHETKSEMSHFTEGYTAYRTLRWTPAFIFSCYKSSLEAGEWGALSFLGRTVSDFSLCVFGTESPQPCGYWRNLTSLSSFLWHAVTGQWWDS